ncbi:MAG TPA: hypothetical protein VN442_02330 [Bryobacteraceae bacterium]|nr:hypothetical protein [Bryobacteraceae bacterium]
MLPAFTRSSRRKSLCSGWTCLTLLFFASAAAYAQRPAEDQEVLRYLDRTIAWYRDVAAAEGSASRSLEAVFTDNLRESSAQVLRSSFQFARADAAIPPAKPAGTAAPDQNRGRNLVQAESTAEQRVEQLQARIATVEREIASVSPRLRPSLLARRDKLEGDLNLAKARRGALRSLIGLMNGADAGLAGKIDDLEHSVPELQSAPKGQVVPAAPARGSSLRDFRPDSSGIVGLSTEVFGISRSMRRLDSLMAKTDELQALTGNLRRPLRSALQEVIRRGDAIASMPETSDASVLSSTRKELDALLARFKLLSALSTPLGQGRSGLNASRASLAEWRGALGEAHSSALRYLLLRLGMLGVAVLVIFLFSEVWRRATVRYVQDMRRRRQFLLLRRIAVGCTIALFVVLSFVTEFGSLATFAGFSAAGIAVAMQSVILSVVAYFFLVGRWGVRVGDRVTVSGVTGDVIDIGLFRLYLMELGGSGLDLSPTGRIVVFPNAVFFQPAAVFKQFPGIDYTWCTLSLALAPESDRPLVEARLLAVVESVYAEYREAIERQHRAAQSAMNVHTALPRPEARLHFVDTRLEFIVRYPVEIRRANEIEDRLTRELVAAIEQEPRLALAAGATPKFQTGSGGRS